MQELFNVLDAPDPFLGALDRQDLLGLYMIFFPGSTGEDIAHATRRELITRIQDSYSGTMRRPEQDIQDYPLRRPNHAALNRELLTRAKDQSVYWCRQANPLVSAALGQDNETFPWNFQEHLRAGDLVLTALEGTPPLIASLEITNLDEADQLAFTNLANFTDPISVAEVESMIGAELPRSSQYLADSVAEKLLGSIGDLVERPRPIFVTAAPCAPSESADDNEVLGVVAILQKASPHEPLLCEICDREISARPAVHLPQTHQDGLRLEIQDHADEVVLLCSDCHEMAHQPTLEQLRNYAKPACPACGERNPLKIIWGMPSFMPDEDEYVTAGCMMPFGTPAQWQCRACETQYLVAEFDDRPHQALAWSGEKFPH
ncbi:hypothetical protein [Glutamicibacter sp.]|uniref:hypothetical protein n=1 Tax=Glutamicibacter sp. TaxID=1931995 RepID=UPI003D6BA22C